MRWIGTPIWGWATGWELVAVQETYPLRNQYCGLKSQWPTGKGGGWGAQKEKNPLSNWQSSFMIIRKSPTPFRNQSPSPQTDIRYVERREYFSHCDWTYHFKNSLRMIILQREASCLPYQRSVIHILASDRSIISKIFYWYWIFYGYLNSLLKSVLIFVLIFFDFYLQEYQACDKRHLHNILPYNNFLHKFHFFNPKYRCPTCNSDVWFLTEFLHLRDKIDSRILK